MRNFQDGKFDATFLASDTGRLAERSVARDCCAEENFLLSSIQTEICMYFLRQEITPFTTYYPQNAILDSFFLNATRCSLTSARILGAGICSQFHGGVLWQAHASISCFVPRRRRTRRGLRGERGYTCSGVLRLLLRVCCFRLRGFPRLLPSLLLALHLRLSLRVCFFLLSFPDFVGSGLSSGMLLFVLRACCAVVVVHAKSQSKWYGVVLSVFLGVFASTVDL